MEERYKQKAKEAREAGDKGRAEHLEQAARRCRYDIDVLNEDLGSKG